MRIKKYLMLFIFLSIPAAYFVKISYEKNCYTPDFLLEREYLKFFSLINSMKNNEDLIGFANNNICNPFIRSSIKVEILKRNHSFDQKTLREINDDIDLFSGKSKRIQILAGLSELAAMNNQHDMAIKYAQLGKDQLETLQVKSGFDSSAVFMLSEQLANLGDFDAASHAAEKLNGDEKNALTYRIKEIRRQSRIPN